MRNEGTTDTLPHELGGDEEIIQLAHPACGEGDDRESEDVLVRPNCDVDTPLSDRVGRHAECVGVGFKVGTVLLPDI